MKALTIQNDYQSTPRTITWLVRKNPSAVFYAKILLIIYQAARLAKKGVYDSDHWVQSSLDTIKALESVGGHLDVQNLKSLQNLDPPCVIIGNHMSVLETFVLPCLIQPLLDVTFVVKDSLIAYPFFGNVLRSRNPIVVGRANAREDFRIVLEEGQNRLNAGISVIIFPQTTRSIHFDATAFNSLGVKLAKRAKVPIIPLALKTDAWGVGKWFKDAGKIRPNLPVHFSFGESLQVQGAGKEEHQFIVNFIANKMKQWNRER